MIFIAFNLILIVQKCFGGRVKKKLEKFVVDFYLGDFEKGITADVDKM